MDFQENLFLRYQTLTPQSRRIADFLHNHPARAIQMTAKLLGEASGTSPAAVIRFCRKLGYDSLEGLKIHLAQGVNAEELLLSPEPMATGQTDLSELSRILFSTTQKALQGTLSLVNPKEFERAITLLKRARAIYIFGVGGSALAAIDLTHKLNRIGKPCIYFSDAHTNLEFASVTTKQDVVVAISYSGETKEVYLAAQGASANGTPVISITRDRPSSLIAQSDIVFRIPDMEKRIRTGAFSSKFSQMFMADLLYLGLIHDEYEAYENLLLDTSRIVRGLKD